jgi:type IV secretory pathway VirB2 component (pilin)
MLYRKIKSFLYNNRHTIALVISLFLYTTDALAGTGNTGTFSALSTAGKTIFSGLRQIVYPAATIGIASVCIGGMFGSFNWKWLIAILIGVFVIAFAEQTGMVATGVQVNMDGDS